MPALVVVTRNVPERLRGFLASSLLEISAGVYVGVRVSSGTRDRLLAVVEEWFLGSGEASVIAVWPDPSAVGGIGLFMLGVPPVALEEVTGLVLARREIPAGKTETFDHVL